ncbi:MAG: hypothetical protein Q9162_002070 [Coniocarpon cinnabarinum]
MATLAQDRYQAFISQPSMSRDVAASPLHRSQRRDPSLSVTKPRRTSQMVQASDHSQADGLLDGVDHGLPNGSSPNTGSLREWEQGGTTCAVIANKCPWLAVTVVDLNADRIRAWNSDNLPIYEPNLYEQVTLSRDGIPGKRKSNLSFSTDVDGAIDAADLIFLAVNTPTKSEGIGAGLALDIGYLESAVRRIAAISDSNKIIVEKSTTPCRTAEHIREILSTNGRPGVQYHVLSNPEFLAEGTAISDLLNPDRILIGSVKGDALEQQAAEALANIYAAWVPRERLITTNLWSSELAKMAANAFLAQRISSINSISSICEATGADVTEVSHAIGLDKRIGPHFLRSSVGFGGSCFQKDVMGLAYLAQSLHLPEVAAYWDQVWQINDWQKQRFSKRIATSLYNTLVNKKIAIFGFAYKKNTGDTRESPAISVVNQLIAERATIRVYDPLVKDATIFSELYSTNNSHKNVDRYVTVEKNPYAAADGANAVVVLTDWDEFKVISSSQLDGEGQDGTERKRSVDWQRITKLMTRPSYVFDGRNVLDHNVLRDMGLKVECIGRRN